MKNFMIIWFLTINAFGFSKNFNNKTTLNEGDKTEVFLTSFVKDDQLFLNIPDQILEKPMMFVRHDQSFDYKYLQVVWSLSKDKILLKVPRIQSKAGTIIPLENSPSLQENILAVFPIDKKSNSWKSNCINITNLILKEEIQWTPSFSEIIVPKLSFIQDVKNLNNEVIIKSNRGLVRNNSKVSVPVYFGFYALPPVMEARRFDYRMGFFNEEKSSISYDTKNSIASITRWRLEKKYKNKDVSVPINPITFVISPKIPKKWRPYVKLGIEEWLPAFESAGFKNALVVKEVETLNNWDNHSLNNSIVRWGNNRNVRGSESNKASTISELVDLRSGEILKSDILIRTSYQSLADGYFIRCAPLDKRALEYPFPDDLMGELIQSLVAHEAGHAFGIMDNNYGEYSYPFEKMRDKAWLENMGHTPSIMTYARHNNIVQPEDSIPPSLLIQKVGPTDFYNIQWAYTSFPNVSSSHEKEIELERIIRLQDSITWYRYNSSQNEIIGPASTNEVVEDNDPVKSTKMALKNLKRVIELLPKVNADQKDNARLERLYEESLDLWYHHMRHVVSLIGGYDIHHKSISQGGSIYTPIALELQEEAIDFLISSAFSPPKWLVNPEFASKINYSTYPDKILEYQQKLLLELLRSQRMKRFEQMEKTKGYEGVSKKYISRFQLGLFKELYDKVIVVDPRKQEIQSTYIDKLIWIISEDRVNFNSNKKMHTYTDYSRGIFMSQLMSLKKNIEKKLKKNKGEVSVGHWKLCLNKLKKVL
ncbi:zinc-dependent metalloprotease [Pontimicrobium aquaticum]|uniref:DUF5117 domain-containing protein n=1 Tax=Pontimicrobium aquaticum TaxID=2565367 RepID=A0A4U0EMV6_9FLAO|nr:zinc-dependent metalloprotease [Pontimicrobium aquaticum]TJY32831.1 DUF5117 domain-containing protein [Pontimicrobium aquaticum]